jgi:hypothetical protein
MTIGNGGNTVRRGNVKAVNRYGVTLLSLACENGDGAMVELFLRRAPTLIRSLRAVKRR